MGKSYKDIQPEHAAFIRKQHLFFVASAPLAEDGRVNLSPKGYDTFRIISSTEVAYLDLTGSGNETSAHLMENGRMTIMFMAFEGSPSILRLYGKGAVALPGTPEWARLSPDYPELPGARQIVTMRVESVSTSCGFSVPYYEYKGERERLVEWADQMGDDRLRTYRAEKNSASIDRLPTHLGQAGG
ncbi:MAG: pyridoxamine 5-phosphate oxidase [Paenibacillus sp.]|jgi:hypothetical protein|nr:pyridoxamine 5-phosphate oxidase [Paenibacillus sp.]